MTKRKHLKRRIRERSAKTGERYTAARRQLRSSAEEAATTMTVTTTEKRAFTFACSFCRKSNEEVKKLIAGPGVYICDECIGLCNDLIGGELAGTEQPPPSLEDGPIRRQLAIFAGMIETSRSIDSNIAAWATTLHERGVTPRRIAAAAGISEDEARERFGF